MAIAHVQTKNQAAAKPNKPFRNYFMRNYDLYLLMIPGLMYLFVFKILPLFGISIAFLDYNIFAGGNPVEAVFKSKFVGLYQFEKIFVRPEFLRALRNTVVISLLKIFFLFPLPVIVALMLNEMRSAAFKRGIQTVIYLPHFMSWVVVSGIFLQLLSNSGFVNQAIVALGLKKVKFFMDSNVFRWVLVFTEGWKGVGWGTIIYLAALAGVDPQLYEAAYIDGAGRWRQTWHITLPGIASTIVLMLILRLGQVMDAGFTQILVMYNPTVYEVSDIIQTFVYRIGLGQMEYSMGTAVGLFNSLIAFILIISTNYVTTKTLKRGIW